MTDTNDEVDYRELLEQQDDQILLDIWFEPTNIHRIGLKEETEEFSVTLEQVLSERKLITSGSSKKKKGQKHRFKRSSGKLAFDGILPGDLMRVVSLTGVLSLAFFVVGGWSLGSLGYSFFAGNRAIKLEAGLQLGSIGVALFFCAYLGIRMISSIMKKTKASLGKALDCLTTIFQIQLVLCLLGFLLTRNWSFLKYFAGIAMVAFIGRSVLKDYLSE